MSWEFGILPGLLLGVNIYSTEDGENSYQEIQIFLICFYVHIEWEIDN